MSKSPNTYLLLAILLVSSLVFSCKTRRTPIITTPNTGSYDGSRYSEEDNTGKTTKVIGFCFDKKDLSAIDPSGYKYSISSDSSSCSQISDDDLYQLTEEGNTVYLEDIELKAPCTYTLKVHLLKKESSDPAPKEVKSITKEIILKESASSTRCYKLSLDSNTTPPTTTTTPSTTNIHLQPVIVD